MSLKKMVRLHNGVSMPQFGLGVFRLHDGPQVENAVLHALKIGYRSIDTASLYGNENGVGNAIHSSGLKREDVFVTTKVWNTQQGYEQTKQAFFESLARLQLDYIDLYLVHWPILSKLSETWSAVEELYAQKKVRAIGVSNFYIHHLKTLINDCSVKPMVNQVELHPLLQLRGLRTFCAQHDIQMEAWASIMRGQVSQLKPLVQIAKKHKKTAPQIALRWAWQNGIIVIPKSQRRERIAENANIFDFELDEGDMKRIDALERNHRLGPHPDTFSS